MKTMTKNIKEMKTRTLVLVAALGVVGISVIAPLPYTSNVVVNPSEKVSIIRAEINGQDAVGMLIEKDDVSQYIAYPPASFAEQALMRDYMMQMPERVAYTFANALRDNYLVEPADNELATWEIPAQTASPELKFFIDHTLSVFPHYKQQAAVTTNAIEGQGDER